MLNNLIQLIMKINSLFFILILLLASTFYAQEDNKLVDNLGSHNVGESSAVDEKDIEIPFVVLNQIPQFESCKDSIGQPAKDCFNKTLDKFIDKNLKYPKQAKKEKVEGKIIIIFTINEQGIIESDSIKLYNKVKTTKEIKQLLEQEVIRVIQLLPKFKPAIHKNKVVKVSYNRFINFNLK